MPEEKKLIKKNVEITALVPEEEQKLTIQETDISNDQILHIMQRTPAKHIYRRKGKGGKNFDYVTGVYVKKVLNYAFGWMWDFEVREHGREDNMVWVLGRLSVKDKKGNIKIVKEQFGRADVKMLRTGKGAVDFGNDLKAATTDALKKCASELGIASDIYGGNEFKEIKIETAKKEVKKENKVVASELKVENDPKELLKKANEVKFNKDKK